MNLSFELNDLNYKAKHDPRYFLAECEAHLASKTALAAGAIASKASVKPIVLLSGPSGSGKTTTAGKLALELGNVGIKCHVISMDDYFKTFNKDTHPRDEWGKIDFESPECLDMPLLTKHFNALLAGEEITLPIYDFINQRRSPEPGKTLRLSQDEVAIFEGIHALNPDMPGKNNASRVYVSARTSVRHNGEMFFKSTWLRLVRRIIRDNNFRGWEPVKTMELWASVRRGEKKYISPFKGHADITIDTSTPSDLPILCSFAKPLFAEVPKHLERSDEMRLIGCRLNDFIPIDEKLVSVKSLLREFIGLDRGI